MPPNLGFGLTLQQLSSDTERVLVAGEVVGLRNGNFRFTTSDVNDLFDGLHVPLPSNTSARLGSLKTKKFVVRTKDGAWALTPQGRLKAQDVIGEIDEAELEPELADVPSSELGQVRHTVIPPLFAPLKWSEPIGRLLEEHPFERNVFLMTRYPSSENDADVMDPVREVIPVIEKALTAHGLELHRADDQQLDDDLLGNVAAYMWACQFGIGLIEDRAGMGLNDNVVIELGGMLITGRRCAFLRDTVTAPAMPTDFVGQIYKPVDFDDLSAVDAAVHLWAALDLGHGRCSHCPAE